MKVIITGASGVLGSAAYNAFKWAHYNPVGLAHSRPTGDLKVLDLLDEVAVEAFFKDYQPDWVIHCAAERRPDVAEKNPEGAQKLNADLPARLAKLSKSLKFKLVYISTDYVFDGTSPPYAPSSPTNPLNLYGRTKRDGELAVLGVDGADAIILRVPVLYGAAPKNSDSAINILLDVVMDQSGKTYKMDHYATRYPTLTTDIAKFLVKLTSLTQTTLRILHFSAQEPFTKYEICLVFAKFLGLSHKHIIPDAEPPKGEAAASRPQNCQLDIRDTQALFSDPSEVEFTLFEEYWGARLRSLGSAEDS